jgi:hypothetical protein
LKKKTSNKLSLFLVFIMLISLVMPNFALNSVSAATVPTDLIISEYIEGSGNNKAIEIYNGTGQTINLANYTVELYSNGGTSPAKLTLPNFNLNSATTYVIVHTSAVQALKDKQNLANGSVTAFNGNDALVLKKGTSVIDSIGKVGHDPGAAGWGTSTLKTTDQTLIRKSSITTGDTNTTDNFDPALQWEAYPIDTFTNLGTHTMVITPEKAQPVIADVASGPVPAGTSVHLSTSTPGATIYFTTNGGNPTTESKVYTSPIIIDQDTTIKAFAKAISTDSSDIATYIYTIIDTTAPSSPIVNPITNADEVITGTAELGATVIANVNGQEIGTSIVDADGNFVIQIPRQNVGTTILISVKDSAGNSSSATEITVTRANLKVNSVLLSVDKQSPQIIGTPVTITANSSGSLEPEYRFFIRDNGNLTILQEYGNNDTITWIPSHSGIYTIIVHAKDKMAPGTGLLFEARTEMTYAVNGGKVTNVQVSSDLSSPLVFGTPISLQATSVGSLDPEYRFFVRENGNLTTLQEYGNSDSITWIPPHSGIYTIIVHAKDKMASGADLRFEARTEMTYVVNGGKVINVQVSSDLSSPQVLGTPISLKASSVGSLEPEYRFFIRENGNLTTLQEYGNSDSITWTPSHSGIYTIIVHAKDKMASGADLRFEARTEMTYVVNGGKVTNVQVSSDLSSPQVLGTAITFKATSVGSLDPEYRFFVLENGNLITLQEYGNSDTITWNPSLPGTYTIIVHAKDKMAPGAGFLYEARTELTFIVS